MNHLIETCKCDLSINNNGHLRLSLLKFEWQIVLYLPRTLPILCNPGIVTVKTGGTAISFNVIHRENKWKFPNNAAGKQRTFSIRKRRNETGALETLKSEKTPLR